MLEISKEANENYLAKVIKIEDIRKHSNADRLQIVTVDFQSVVTGLDAKKGDIYVYFPVEGAINKQYLSATNSFREKELNIDTTKVGFFEKHCRIKAIKLRGEKSMGYIVPIESLETFTGVFDYQINQEFDTINGIKMVKKYIPKHCKQDGNGLSNSKKKVKHISRTIDNQINLHVSTANLRKNLHQLELHANISITNKTHGTSWWVGNVLTKRKLSWIDKVLLWFGVMIQTTVYDVIYGSRKKIKNEYFDYKPKYDLWSEIKRELEGKIPKGYTLYGEAMGFTPGGKAIQKGYDYGQKPNDLGISTFKAEVYRITHTTEDGLVTELTYPQIKEFCERMGLEVAHCTYTGSIIDCLNGWNIDWSKATWKAEFLKRLEETYNEKDCSICTNKVPEEGIVVRVESLFKCESYKLKSFRFLEGESKQLDSGEVDMESEN